MTRPPAETKVRRRDTTEEKGEKKDKRFFKRRVKRKKRKSGLNWERKSISCLEIVKGKGDAREREEADDSYDFTPFKTRMTRANTKRRARTR